MTVSWLSFSHFYVLCSFFKDRIHFGTRSLICVSTPGHTAVRWIPTYFYSSCHLINFLLFVLFTLYSYIYTYFLFTYSSSSLQLFSSSNDISPRYPSVLPSFLPSYLPSFLDFLSSFLSSFLPTFLPSFLPSSPSSPSFLGFLPSLLTYYLHFLSYFFRFLSYTLIFSLLFLLSSSNRDVSLLFSMISPKSSQVIHC